MEQGTKIVFFIRANNDVDHFTPVMWELSSRPIVQSVTIINWNPLVSFKQDYRITPLLAKSNVKYVNLWEVSNDPFQKKLFTRIKWSDRIYKIPILGTKFYGHLVNLENSITYSETNWDQLIPPGCVVMMDHSTSIFTKSLLKVLNNKNIPVGMLMHGLDPTSNLLHDENSVELPGIGAFSYLSENSSLFVVNNSVYAEKCLRFGVAPDKMRILGSPRFSKKWSMTLSNLLPNSDIKKYGNGQFKVCIMLSKWMYNNWEEETHRVIRTLLRIDGVFLFIKPHTRGMKFENKSSENCFVDNENTYNSRSIIEWSNLVLFSISSIFLDALLLDKPVLHLKLTTSNKMACQHIMKSWNVDCRDDLIHWVEKLKKDEFCRTYTKKEAEDCLDYYVKDRDGKMLERYCSEILEIGKNGK